MRASKALEALFLDYVAYYEDRWLQGKLIACNETATTEKVKHILTAAPRLSQELGGFTLHSIISTCVLKANDHRTRLKTLISAFEFLELVCVNLYLCPWRKEFKSLKTFTGRFVYSVQSVLPEEILKGIFQKIGYTTKTATEFLVTEDINEKEKQQFAFEIFLARMECQLILEKTNDAKTLNCLKFLKERAETPANSDVKDGGTPATVKEHPVNVLNDNIQKTTRVHFEMSKDGTMGTEGMHQSETTGNETLARKDKCHTEPYSDGNNKAIHIPFSVEPSKTKITSISQSASHGNSSKELHRCNLSDSANLDNKGLNLFTLAENKKLPHKGHNFSQSSKNLQMNSRVTRLSEITESQERPGQDSSESDGNEHVNNKILNPLKSAEKEKMDIQSLNPSKSSDNTTDKQVPDPFMFAKNTHTYRKELCCSTPAKNTVINKNELIPSDPTEDNNMAKENYFRFTFNAESNGSSKSNSGSAGDRMFPHLQSSEDRRDSKTIYNPISPLNEINKGMHTSNSDPKIHAPSCARESADRILDPTREAAACFQSNRSESEEFLTQYSDLNIAQKPVIKESPSQNKKQTIGRKDDAVMLEESTTDEPKPLRLYEEKPRGFEVYTEATSNICKPEKELAAIQEAYDDIPGKNFTTTNPSNKPPIAESCIIKNETALSFCNVPVAEHEESDDEECELASSFSKLKISECPEQHVAEQIEKTSSSEAAGFKKKHTINKIQAHVENSTSRIACSPHNNIAERNFSLPNSLTKITECAEGIQLESGSRPHVHTLGAGMPLDNYRQIKEPPGSTYIPPDSLKNQPFEEDYDSSYFKFRPEDNVDKHSSTDTVPVGDSVFQVNEDLKEDFVIISRPMAPND